VFERVPASETRLTSDDRPVPGWPDVRERIAAGGRFWLATSRADGAPHVMPLLTVMVDGEVFFSAGPSTRKAKNLAMNARCVLTHSSESMDIIIEGHASKVRDEGLLRRVADAYDAKCGWQVEVRDGALHGEGAPTAGPGPYEVYAVTLDTVFGFGTDESLTAMRWRF
jgi:hypothetical protein